MTFHLLSVHRDDVLIAAAKTVIHPLANRSLLDFLVVLSYRRVVVIVTTATTHLIGLAHLVVLIKKKLLILGQYPPNNSKHSLYP